LSDPLSTFACAVHLWTCRTWRKKQSFWRHEV